MEKHEDNLDKLLKAELEKEAGEIMEEMDSDESLQDISFPEDLDEKMWSKIQEYEEQQKAYEVVSTDDSADIMTADEETTETATTETPTTEGATEATSKSPTEAPTQVPTTEPTANTTE